jgi:integration host factor subunit beta
VIKSQLMVRVASQTPHLFQRDVNKVVDAVLDKIVAALARGDRVELRGFGTFGTKVREGILRRELQFTYLKRRFCISGRATKSENV